MSAAGTFKVSEDNSLSTSEEKCQAESQSSDDGSSIMSRHSSLSSTPRSISPFRRAGINLGLSVIGNSSSFHSQPVRALDEERNLQATGPLGLRKFHARAYSSPQNTSLIKDQLSEAESRSQELSERLRLLASKEMQILELKSTIKELIGRKLSLEEETAILKRDLQKEVVKHVTQEYSSRARTRASTLDAQRSHQKDSKLGHFSSPGSYPNGDRKSWLASPVNFLQQFDSAVMNELNNLQEPPMDRNKHHALQVDTKRRIAKKEDVDSNGREIGSPLKSLAEKHQTTSDLVQSVSQHLWSFVNDVKESISLDNPTMDSSILEKSRIYPQNKRTCGKSNANKQIHNTSLQNADPDNSQVTEDDLWDDEDLIDI